MKYINNTLLLLMLISCKSPDFIDPIYQSDDIQMERMMELTNDIEDCLNVDADTIGSYDIFYTTPNFIVIKEYRVWGDWGRYYNARSKGDSVIYELDSIAIATHLKADTIMADTGMIITYHTYVDSFWEYKHQRYWPWVGLFEVIPRWYFEEHGEHIGYYSAPWTHVYENRRGTATIALPPDQEIRAFMAEMIAQGCKLQIDTIPEDSLTLSEIGNNLSVGQKKER